MTLAAQLSQFTGTDNWYRHPLNRKMVWTDGAEHFAEKAQARWFIDAVAIGANGHPGIVPAVQRDPGGFAVVLLHVKNDHALIEAFDDVPGRCLYSESIGWTDCPEGEWKFYCVDDGEHVVLMLPSEY